MQTININSTLTLTNPVVIDGTSQPSYNGTPLISVQGNASVSNLFVLDSGSSGSTIQGLDLTDYISYAVELTVGSSGDFIQNNWIGFFRDPTTGQVSLNYNLGVDFGLANGIFSYSSNTVIRNNVIDGTINGIVDVGYNNSITANFIGTDPSGTTAAGYGNVLNGIVLDEGCQATVVAGNLLSGNLGSGIIMEVGPIPGSNHIPGYNAVSGNKIGTDVALASQSSILPAAIPSMGTSFRETAISALFWAPTLVLAPRQAILAGFRATSSALTPARRP
jgi:hypothetical protein